MRNSVRCLAVSGMRCRRRTALQPKASSTSHASDKAAPVLNSCQPAVRAISTPTTKEPKYTGRRTRCGGRCSGRRSKPTTIHRSVDGRRSTPNGFSPASAGHCRAWSLTDP